MKLRGIEFGNILSASGVQGFFGEGYWFHKPFKPFGLDFSNVTFVSKTATILPRQGNMPLNKHYAPRHLFPSCVRVQPLRGNVLNAVGLSNPGLAALLARGEWQKRKKPFLISIALMADNPLKRLEELRLLIGFLELFKNQFYGRFGLEINLSCPNTGHVMYELLLESVNILNIAGRLDVPLVLKFSIASSAIEVVRELQGMTNLDAICVSNTIPHGWKGLSWQRVWGESHSPLAHYGGGGLSGRELQPLVCAWIHKLRELGFTKPIVGGGGILGPEDVVEYHRAGASAVFIGSVALLRPWRVKDIVWHANQLVWNYQLAT